MSSVQPHGPYYFGGLCDGAHLAIRMAQKLEEQGQEIGMLAIFDTWVLENSQHHLAWLMSYYVQRFEHFRKLGWTDQIHTISRTMRTLARKALGRQKRRSVWAEAYWPEEGFIPPAIKGRITLFKRPKQPYHYVRDPEMGWGARAAGGVDVQVLPIDHEEMLREPHVQVLARRLRVCLLDYYRARDTQPSNGGAPAFASIGSESEAL